MKLDAKTIYAQSSDIKSRTYLEYRRDMKRKAIAELEVIEWLEKKLKKLNPKKKVKIYKSGGDKFLWFLRKGGISREPDFIAEINGDKIEFEFQYAEKENLDFYDFKISKVSKKKGNRRVPIDNKFFIYIHKPLLKYAIFNSDWIMKNGEYGMVEAWRSYAFRIPKHKFEKILLKDKDLPKLCYLIDAKNYLLNFQHNLIEINRDKLSYLFQQVIDDNKILKIIPKDLDSFFKVCFVLDHLNKIPQNANLWLVYILSYIKDNLSLEDISKIVYSIDFLYSKVELQSNEINLLVKKIKELERLIDKYSQEDGSYKSSLTASPLDETRYALFSINLLEDLIQDIIFYYSVKELKPIEKIYQSLKYLDKTYKLIKDAMDKMN